ncbi:hypothetical protein CO038_01390 [Candidatus Pacearchaeota archaeon CG_4_9_14_0_2_um_filter_39_13]|nr:MAG: hypothetical protein CO038_01390 [Candidatus Pacearchaeota archaeon CG_4_9_14_0_2_um_filter_39_13]
MKKRVSDRGNSFSSCKQRGFLRNLGGSRDVVSENEIVFSLDVVPCGDYCSFGCSCSCSCSND